MFLRSGRSIYKYCQTFQLCDQFPIPSSTWKKQISLNHLQLRTMYLRKDHAELHVPTLFKFIKDNPLGILTTAISSPNYPLIQTSHIPFVFDPPSNIPEVSSSESNDDLGNIRGHLARANPHSKALIESVTTEDDQGNKVGKQQGANKLEQEVMVLFNGPVNHYVTPKFYTTTKPATGKVVSTWNYSAVQVYGTATIFFDTKHPSTNAFLSRQLDDLATLTEEVIMGFDGKEGRKGPWTVNEAPESYINLLKKAIIGIEIKVTRIAGKFKMSQELGDGDREGTVNGFRGLGTEAADKVAETIEERQRVKEARKNGCPV
jgi:transcriptional regulator